MTHAGTFALYRRLSGNKPAYSKTEAYMLTDYAEGKSISAAAFSKNTNYTAAALTDFSIQIHFKLRFTQDMITRTVEGHKAEIYGLAFSNNEQYLASVSIDGNVYIWSCANYTQTAHIETVYTNSKIPAYFTADSLSIITIEDDSSVRISNLQGQKTARINTGNSIIALYPLSDPDKIAILNDKNEIVIYSIQLQKAVGVMRLPKTETSDITAFAFCHTEQAAFAGCASGAVYKIKPERLNTAKPAPHAETPPETDAEESLLSKRHDDETDQGTQEQEPQGVEEEAMEAEKPFKPALKTEKASFLAISTLMGFLQPEKTNYQYLFGADVCFRNTYFTAPVYIGAGIRGHIALPKRPFPVQYEDFNGNALAPPLLWIGEVYVPAGIEVVLDRRGYAVLFEEAALTARLSTLNRPKAASSKLFFSYGGRLTTGISVKFFTFSVGLNYDSLWKLFPEITLGGRIDFKSIPEQKKVAS